MLLTLKAKLLDILFLLFFFLLGKLFFSQLRLNLFLYCQSISNLNANDATFYNLLDTRFDIENYIDYFIIQTYIQNMDWLGIAWGANNIKLWRPQRDNGKWRYVLYDTDAAFGSFGQNANENYLDYAINADSPNIHSMIFGVPYHLF